jgi:hypothetical protein
MPTPRQREPVRENRHRGHITVQKKSSTGKRTDGPKEGIARWYAVDVAWRRARMEMLFA